MLKRVVGREDWAAKYRASFGGPLVDAFATVLFERGYPRASIKHILRDGKKFIDWGKARGLPLTAIDDEAVALFDRRNARCAPSHDVRVALRCNARHLVDFLRERDIVPSAPEKEASPLAEFEEWMRVQRGARPATIALYTSILQRKVLPRLRRGARTLSAGELRRAVLHDAAKHTPEWTQCVINAARAFVRFEAVHGRCSVELVHAIPSVAKWKLATLPRHVSSNDVERIIAACAPTSPARRRDRAVILLLARLALRASDISALTFDDVDWSGGRVRVVGKGRREDWLPLPQDVGDALIAYLRQDRPVHTSTRVFLTTRAPHRPICGRRVTGIVTEAVQRSGVETPTRGAHLLRHSAAVTLLDDGLGLESIAAVLRHASSETTSLYAKVDKPLLLTVVAPWPRSRACPLPHQGLLDADLQNLRMEWPRDGREEA